MDQSTKHTCTRCGKEFTAPNWKCEDGYPHQVPSKTYYVRTEGLTVFYGPVRGDQVQNRTRGVITFQRGTFQTTDPQQQEFLDSYHDCCSAEEWRDKHIDDKERAELSKKKSERLEKENNELLAKIKQLEEEKAAAGAGSSTPPDGKKGK